MTDDTITRLFDEIDKLKTLIGAQGTDIAVMKSQFAAMQAAMQSTSSFAGVPIRDLVKFVMLLLSGFGVGQAVDFL